MQLVVGAELMVVRLPIGVSAGEKRWARRTEQWRSGEIVETGKCQAKAGAQKISWAQVRRDHGPGPLVSPCKGELRINLASSTSLRVYSNPEDMAQT
jgi:hypothetical protein